MASPKFVIPLLLLTFAAWGVYLGGLAALQNQCFDDPTSGTAGTNGVFGFSPAILGCSRIYRFAWFIVAFEFVTIVGLLISTAVGRLWHARLAFIGMFSICTLLTMLMTESLLTLMSSPRYDTGTPKRRLDAAFAGAISLVAFNIFVILALGIDTAVLAATTAGGPGYYATTTTAAPAGYAVDHKHQGGMVPATAV